MSPILHRTRFLILICTLFLQSCATRATVDELRNRKELLSYYVYLGSDPEFHYIKNNGLLGDRTYKVPRSELSIREEFEYSPVGTRTGESFYAISKDGKPMDVVDILVAQ